MILWDGTDQHERDEAERCWRSVEGGECGEPSTTDVGLCAPCVVELREPVLRVIALGAR